jgi:hypothetical protein
VLTPVIYRADGGGFGIFVDNISLLQKPADKFAEALEAWFAAFWVLTVAYPKQLANTMTFMERILLRGKGGKVPACVTKWATRLNATAVSPDAERVLAPMIDSQII